MKTNKNYELEHLRAIAIGLTLISHLPVLLPFHQNYLLSIFSIYMPWSGVDLFFCISGYIVSKTYLDFIDRYHQEGRFWLGARIFWVKRLYRLLPTAWLWILIPLLLSIIFNRSGSFGSWYDNLRSFTAVATFSGNLANQFGMALGPNSVYWSLALEEQFYFIFPLFLLAITNYRWRITILLGLIFLQFFFNRNPYGTAASALASSFRLDAIMWGVLIFLLSRKITFREFEPIFLRGSPLTVLTLNLFFLYLLGAIPAQLIETPIAVGLIAVNAAILVFLASFNNGYIFSMPLLSDLLTWVGSRSYGMYVIHIPAYKISHEIWYRNIDGNELNFNGGLTAELLITAALLIVLLSELNYRLIECPLRRRGSLVTKRLLAAEPDTATESEPAIKARG